MERVLKKAILMILLFFTSLVYANEDEIRSKLEMEFLSANDGLEIESIDLKFTSRADINGYKFKDIYINKPTLKRNIGTFKVIFEKNGKEKAIFYRYKVNGQVLVLKINKDLNRGDLISENDIEFNRIEFKYKPYDYVVEKKFLKRAILKRSVKKDTILTENLIEIVSDIKRGDSVLAILNEGTIAIKFEVIALNNGHIGDVIRVRNNNGVIFNGKVISEDRVEIE